MMRFTPALMLLLIAPLAMAASSAFALTDAEARKAFEKARQQVIESNTILEKDSPRSPSPYPAQQKAQDNQQRPDFSEHEETKSQVATQQEPLKVRHLPDHNVGLQADRTVQITGLDILDEAPVLSLNKVRFTIDAEDQPLLKVVDAVVAEVAEASGPWTVKWRLEEENKHLMRARFNLLAESTFGEFMNLLVRRVKNMTGIDLFVTVFDSSRIILIADTYY